MKTLLTLAALSLILAPKAYGRDSTWVLCSNESLVVNALEHRAGQGRATGLTMIYGDRVLRGEIADDAKKVSLKDAGSKLASTFRGEISIPVDMSSISLKGDLVLDGQKIATVTTTLSCKEMDADQL